MKTSLAANGCYEQEEFSPIPKEILVSLFYGVVPWVRRFSTLRIVFPRYIGDAMEYRIKMN